MFDIVACLRVNPVICPGESYTGYAEWVPTSSVAKGPGLGESEADLQYKA